MCIKKVNLGEEALNSIFKSPKTFFVEIIQYAQQKRAVILAKSIIKMN